MRAPRIQQLERAGMQLSAVLKGVIPLLLIPRAEPGTIIIRVYERGIHDS